MEQEMTIDLKDLIDIIKKRLALIISVTAVMTLASGIISWFFIEPTYEAKSTVIIGKVSQANDEKIQYNDLMMYQKLVKTYAVIAKSEIVAEKTLTTLKLETPITIKELESSTIVTPQSDTQIIDVKAQSGSAEDAAQIANKLTEQFIDRIRILYPTENIQVLDQAKVPSAPIKPNKMLNVAIAFVLGLMLSLLAIFTLEYMDTTIKSEKDIENYLGLPVIGVIPKHGGEK